MRCRCGRGDLWGTMSLGRRMADEVDELILALQRGQARSALSELRRVRFAKGMG